MPINVDPDDPKSRVAYYLTKIRADNTLNANYKHLLKACDDWVRDLHMALFTTKQKKQILNLRSKYVDTYNNSKTDDEKKIIIYEYAKALWIYAIFND